jgi:hypothetical protein
MPASCQSRSPRQQVMPEPQPNSCGSISQWYSATQDEQNSRDKHGLANEVCLPWVCAVRVAAAVESDSTRHLEAEECSWTEHPKHFWEQLSGPATGAE